MTEEFETSYQLLFFATVIALVLLEQVRVLRRQPVQRERRWPSNIGLFLIGGLITAVVIPAGVYGFALSRPPGLLSGSGVPSALAALSTFLLLDLYRYWEHRLFHRVPLLWRAHLVHHSDTQVDVSTSERHHPLEVVAGIPILLAVIAVLGLPAPAVGLYLLAATVVSLCSHANLRLPAAFDRFMRWLLVTPAVHAVHHSDLRAQTDSNYGSVLTVWDRMFGTFVDPERAKVSHFGLDYFHQPRDTSLAKVLQQPFLYRRDLVYPARDRDSFDESAPSSTPAEIARKHALAGAIAGCVLISVVMWPTWVQLAGLWTNEPYQYAWLVLPMMAYLLAGNAPLAVPPVVPSPEFKGVLVVMLAAALWGVGALVSIDVVKQLALVAALQGVAMSALGWRSYRRLLPIFALLFLLVPSGDLLQPILLESTVKAIEAFATMAQLPHSVQGLLVVIDGRRYVVAEECSGLAYVTLAIFLGYSFGLLLYRSFAKIAALTLFSALLGVACNAIRVNAIVIIDYWLETQMDLSAHGAIQWVALVAVLAVLFYMLSRLRGDPAAPTAEGPSIDQSTGTRRLAPIIAGASALWLAAPALGLSAVDALPPRGAINGMFPSEIAGWTLTSPQVAWIADPRAGTESVTLTYTRDGREARIMIVETLSPAAKLPAFTPASVDWKLWRGKREQVVSGCSATRCATLMQSAWPGDGSQSPGYAYHVYGSGSFTSVSRSAARVAHSLRRASGSRDHAWLIAFVFEGRGGDPDNLVTTLEGLQSALDNRLDLSAAR